jgi:hypothetical protein
MARATKLALCTVVALALTTVGAYATCDLEVRTRIVDQYVEGYHAQWGEGSPRQQVDDILTSFGREVGAVLGGGEPEECRFSEIITRSLPTASVSGPQLDKNAQAVHVVLEFAVSGDQFCVGLNNDRKLGQLPDPRYPHRRQPALGRLPMTYLHFAMKCFDKHGATGQYAFY